MDNMTRERMDEILKNCFQDVRITRAEAQEMVAKAKQLKDLAGQFHNFLGDFDFYVGICDGEDLEENDHGNLLLIADSHTDAYCEIID